VIRILLLGRDGQVGWELQRTLQPLGELVTVERDTCDLTQPAQVRETVRSAKPDLIVNAAAYTAVDKAESEPALAHSINAEAPALLAEEARRLGAALIHYSTDYVFDGAKREPYVEGDPVGPLSVYGRSKLQAEQAIAASGASNLVLRTSWVYAARGQNFVRTMLRLARNRETLQVVDDQIGAPTWARTLAEATALIVARCAGDRAGIAAELARRGGLYHLTASGSTSWHGLAREIFALVPDPGRRLRSLDAIPTAAYPTAARRPANSRLSCARLEQCWSLRMPDWQSALRLCLQDGDPLAAG
jgi:dTDP-4-dehydrorhamnose reductase